MHFEQEKKLRILVVSQYFWPENFRINDLVSELCIRGHNVTVLTAKPNYPDGSFFEEYIQSPQRFSHYRGANVVRVPIIPRGKGGIKLILNYISFFISASLIGLIKLRGKSYDAIFVFEPSPITVGIPAVILGRVKKVPVAFWVLDLWPETLSAIGVVKSKRVLTLIGKLVSWIYNRCDLILAQSKSFIPQIEKYCTNKEKIKYFPSWSDTRVGLEGVAPTDVIVKQDNGFTVLFAGNIGDAQDFPAILAAADLLKKARVDIRWLIVGDGRLAAWLKAEILRLELTDSVVMLGRHPVETMPSFFKHADVLLLSLKDEPIFSMTIPGKLQSYLATGLPVLAMLNGEGADVVSRAKAGVVCSAGDSEGLAKAITQLAGLSKEEREALGSNGLKLTTTEFNREALISKLEQWLCELSAKHKMNRVKA